MDVTLGQRHTAPSSSPRRQREKGQRALEEGSGTNTSHVVFSHYCWHRPRPRLPPPRTWTCHAKSLCFSLSLSFLFFIFFLGLFPSFHFLCSRHFACNPFSPVPARMTAKSLFLSFPHSLIFTGLPGGSKGFSDCGVHAQPRCCL